MYNETDKEQEPVPGGAMSPSTIHHPHGVPAGIGTHASHDDGGHGSHDKHEGHSPEMFRDRLGVEWAELDGSFRRYLASLPRPLPG